MFFINYLACFICHLLIWARTWTMWKSLLGYRKTDSSTVAVQFWGTIPAGNVGAKLMPLKCTGVPSHNKGQGHCGQGELCWGGHSWIYPGEKDGIKKNHFREHRRFQPRGYGWWASIKMVLNTVNHFLLVSASFSSDCFLTFGVLKWRKIL